MAKRKPTPPADPAFVLQEGAPLRLHVAKQGAVDVGPGQGRIRLCAQPFILVSAEMSSKYPDIGSGQGQEGEAPGLSLYASEETLYLKPGFSRDTATILLFPDLVGYQLEFAKRSGKCTLSLLFIREGAEAAALHREFEAL